MGILGLRHLLCRLAEVQRALHKAVGRYQLGLAARVVHAAVELVPVVLPASQGLARTLVLMVPQVLRVLAQMLAAVLATQLVLVLALFLLVRGLAVGC
ncbi:MAG: hypothetical protein RDU24_08760 [Humidesulfovibrio sp.]|uniref:hypothetical protein n=1 Tax=Humidesulfovibrio sp. TaxID=2910988 RepID=UPI0027F455FF|nr:hypothetical protein [Humidesulfovibrio sp.]MDQ7835458.1 hypothetical protein [Humidesulfovibrio sp.]